MINPPPAGKHVAMARFRLAEAILQSGNAQAARMELEDLAAALARLPQEQSAVLLLVALDEMRYEDIAQTLNIPIGTVMSRLARGRERLRRMLDEHPNPSNLRVVR